MADVVKPDASVVLENAETFRMLSDIIQKLRQDDICHLIFVSRCLLDNRYEAREIWLKKDCGRLFEVLTLSYSFHQIQAILKEALMVILRVDLARKISVSFAEEENIKLPPLIVCLYEIYDDTTQADREEIIFKSKDFVFNLSVDTNHAILTVFLSMISNGDFSFSCDTESVNQNRHVLNQIVPNLEVFKRKIDKYAAAAKAITPNSVKVPDQRLKPIQETRGDDSTSSHAASKPLPLYELNPSDRIQGICVIINNELFNKNEQGIKPLSDRQASHHDRDFLEKVFTMYGFDVKIHSNLTSEELKTKFEYYGSLDHSPYKIFTMCILSHGERNAIYGVDNKLVPINYMIQSFTSTKCQSLVNKPKLFFLQCCQGKDFIASGTSKHRVGGNGDPTGILPTISNENILDRDIEHDMYIAYATLPGTVSWRRDSKYSMDFKGTWFIRCLCGHLETYGSNLTLANIMVSVKNDLSELSGHYYDKRALKIWTVKQYAYDLSSLIKGVQLILKT